LTIISVLSNILSRTIFKGEKILLGQPFNTISIYEHGDNKLKKNQALLFENAQAEDTIIALEVSRLPRSAQQLCEIIDVIRENASA